MKRIVLLALLAMALPLASFASSSVDFTNSGGVLSGSSAGMTLTGSELIAVNGLGGLGLVTGALGGVSFSTGSLISGGSLQMGGSFNGGGNYFHRIVHWTGDLDSDNPGQRHSQLHPDRFNHGHLVHRFDRGRRDRAVDH